MFPWNFKVLSLHRKKTKSRIAEKNVPAGRRDIIHNETSSRETTRCHSFYQTGGEIHLRKAGIKASMFLREIVGCEDSKNRATEDFG